MQIKPGFAMRKIAGSNIVVPVGAATSDFNGMITLNDTGAFLWNCFLQPTTEAQVVEALMHEYEVERQRAAADVRILPRCCGRTICWRNEKLRAAGCHA